MTIQEKVTRVQNVRDAIRTLANARARTTRFQHGAENAVDVAKAKAKAAAAKAGATAAELKRDAEKHLDDARVNAFKGKGKGK
jgi:outer membrane protein TolC